MRVNVGGIELKNGLFWQNEKVSYKFSLYYSSVGVTFGRVELTGLNVDIAEGGAFASMNGKMDWMQTWVVVFSTDSCGI